MAEFIGTKSDDRFVGGTENDLFYFTPKFMASTDQIDGGAGTNTLVLWNDTASNWSVSAASWPKLSNIQGIALVSRNSDGYDTPGFKLTFDNTFFKLSKVSHFTVDAYWTGGDGGSLRLYASTVTNTSFDVYGSIGPYFDDLGEQPSYDVLRTGSKNDRFIYYANSLAQDSIDGGAGFDTILLVGAGHTTTKNGHEKTDPVGFSSLEGIKNVEKVIVTNLSAGQTRVIDFGYGGVSQGRSAISIETNSNYGAGKVAAPVDGKLIIDGSGIKSTLSSLHVRGGNGADLMIGGAADDRLFGGNGNDTLVNGYGSDRLSGGWGNDTFFGEIDIYRIPYEFRGGVWGKLGNGEMYGGEGDDVFYFSLPYKESRLNIGVISGGTGTDILCLRGRDIPKDVFDSATVSGIEIIELADIGNTFAVNQAFLTKNHDENGRLWIQNKAGSRGLTVTIDASEVTSAQHSVHIAVRSPGTEFLTGGMGNDVFDYSLVTHKKLARLLDSGLYSTDTISGGGGVDTILISEGRKATLGRKVTGVEELKVVGKSTSGEKTEIFVSTTEALSIDGRQLGANDSLVARGYYTNPKSGTLYQAKASLDITGGRGDDLLTGGRANDHLRGGSGDDTLTGYKGSDRLVGGKGADHFVFADASDSLPTIGDRDFIRDFKQSEGDKIHFLHEGSAAYSYIGASAFHGKAGEVRSFVSTSNTYVQLDVDGDGMADLGIGLAGKMTLTQNDFIL